ncbi:hypothetical protein CC2G_000288 [Coprinopsis cinerea AmutBmut pab1-1]|nr:hypothetical protein CC2G_000288 [Coprinopsis cinerea AmutBmut pab1-1]
MPPVLVGSVRPLTVVSEPTSRLAIACLKPFMWSYGSTKDGLDLTLRSKAKVEPLAQTQTGFNPIPFFPSTDKTLIQTSSTTRCELYFRLHSRASPRPTHVAAATQRPTSLALNSIRRPPLQSLAHSSFLSSLGSLRRFPLES